MKVVVDISNMMSDFESHKNYFFILNYEFLKSGVSCRIFFIYNLQYCLVLTVIDPENETVYFMDPLKRRLIVGEFRVVVDT